MTKKTYYANIYAPTVSGTTDGALLATIENVSFSGFDWAINSGLGESQIKFPLQIKSFNEGTTIALYNQFKIYVNDNESSPQGDLVYSGYLVDYSQYLDGIEEYIEGTLWGYATEFPQKVLESIAGNTQLAYTNTDPSLILQNIFTTYDGKVNGQNSTKTIIENFSSDSQEDFGNTQAIWKGGLRCPVQNDAVNVTGIDYEALGSEDSLGFRVDWTPTQSGNLTTVRLKLKRGSTLSAWGGDIYVVVNTLGGASVVSTNTFNQTTLTTSYAECDFTFTGLNVVAGTLYYISVYYGGDTMASVFVQGGTHPGGRVVQQRYGPVFMNQSLNYWTNVITAGSGDGHSGYGQSIGYDTQASAIIPVSATPTAIVPTGCSITYQYSDSTDNATWNAWTSDFTTLRHRYIRWKATLTGTSTDTPLVTGMTFSVQAGTINLTGTSSTYTFNQNTYQEALNAVLKLSPAYWYWRVGADNNLVYDARNTNIINHILTIGKDISSIRLTRSVQDLANTFYFTGGNGGGGVTYTKTNRTASQSTYGKRCVRQQDQRITDNTTAGVVANAYMDWYDHALLTATITVADSNGDTGGYDIESLKPGQVVKINDPQEAFSSTFWDVDKWDVAAWDFPITSAMGVPFQIMSVQYKLDSATLQLAYLAPDGAQVIEGIAGKLTNTITVTAPAAPSIV